MQKKVLLIAGGGTLGTYVAQELLKMGHFVDVLCLEDKFSDNNKLTFYKGCATEEYLATLLAEHHYDGIVNFVHYQDVEAYRPIHKLLTEHTEHLIFLSSYRVYADKEHPIKEESPMLLDVTEDLEFKQNEKYAIVKAKCEKFLRDEDPNGNWTIVRPVISFSKLRFDFFMHSGRDVLSYARDGKTMIMQEFARNFIAGLDWSGNTGKIIAHLLFKKETIGEAYTISSAPGLTWGEIAKIYEEHIGLKVMWTDEETYLKANPHLQREKGLWWAYLYDRRFDRAVDNTKVLKATGLGKKDFLSLSEGLDIELSRLEM